MGKKFNLRKFFGYIELILGLILLTGVISGAYFLVNILQNPPSLINEVNLNENNGESSFEQFLFYGVVANFLLIYLGFKVIFLVLAVILIFNGLLDIKGD